MVWKVILAVFALHVVSAAAIMRHQARRVCGWKMSLPLAVGGQLAISIAGLMAGLGCILLAGEAGLPPLWGLYALGGMAGVIAWGLALRMLVQWMAQRAKGAFYSPVTMRRVSTRSFICVMACYGGALLLAFGAWRATRLPAADAHTGLLAPATQMAGAQNRPARESST